jgi:hypothetical protein
MALVNAFGKPIDVAPENIVGKFRDAFRSFTPGVDWNLTQGDGDVVQLDGNAVSASYLVISKDPLSAGGVTTLETTASFDMPLESAVGFGMSQRVVGQEFAMELVSIEEPSPSVADIPIATISQTTTTLTVVTSSAHGLSPGMRVGIFGCNDSRMNYPSLVIAATQSATQFTCTAGPAGTIPSATIGAQTTGFVYVRSALGGAQNGISQIFENASTTNASCYTRASAGDALPSGTTSGNHSINTAVATNTQSINSPFTYAFLPTSEFRLISQADRVQWMDAAIDSTSVPTSRLFRTQVVPDPTQKYKLRFRFTNNKGRTVPVGKIVSAVKSGSTTATITTDAPHGLTTSDFVVIYGIRNQTSFANQTTQVVVASVPSSTTFTVVFGASATATSYGGMVARVNGAVVPSAFPAPAAQNASVDANNLFITGSANWAWLIGDYVNVYGLRNDSTGADLGVDGAYRVENVSTTSIRLAPLDSLTVLPTLSSTNCGGVVIKRTDVRISFVRIFDYLRERVEVQPNGALAAQVPVAAAQNGSWNLVPINQNSFTLASSTNLGAGATFTGNSTNAAAATTSAVVYFTSVNVAVTHLAGLTPGTLIYEVGTETSSTAPTVWYPAFTIPIPSVNGWQSFTLPVSTRWYRFRFVNGAVAQTVFRISQILQYNGAMSNPLSFPDTITYPLSVTNLTGGSTFTGPTLDFGETMSVYKTITAQVFASHASATDGFKIQVSRDGTTFRDAVSATVTANTLTRIEWGLIYRYVRVVYTNGATTQTTFELFANADVR